MPSGSLANGSPPRLRDARQVAQQVSEIVIDSDGRVSNCKGTQYSGAATPESDACLAVTDLRFAPATGGASLTATVVVTAYVRGNSVT